MPPIPKIETTITVPRALYEENYPLFLRGQEVEFDGVKYLIQDITVVRVEHGFYFEYHLKGRGRLSIHQQEFWVRESALRQLVISP